MEIRFARIFYIQPYNCIILWEVCECIRRKRKSYPPRNRDSSCCRWKNTFSLLFNFSPSYFKSVSNLIAPPQTKIGLSKNMGLFYSEYCVLALSEVLLLLCL